MNGNAIALDTNQAIAIMNADGDSSSWIAGYATVLIPVPVLGELQFGMLNSREAARNLRNSRPEYTFSPRLSKRHSNTPKSDCS